MTNQSDFESLRAFIDSDPRPAVNIVLAASPTGNALRRPNITEGLASDFHTIASKWVDRTKNAVVKPYTPGYKPDTHELLSLEVATDENVSLTVASLQTTDSLPVLTSQPNILEQTKFYCAVLEDNKNKAIFFRRTTQGFELTRRFPFAAFFSDGSYNKIDHKVLLFDDEFDCYAWNGALYVKNVAAFQSMFNYFESLRQQANATIDDILTRVPIKNPDEFRAACIGQAQMLSKLSSISSKAYLSTLTLESIKTTADEFNIELAYEENSDGQESIVFSNHPTKRWNILKVLDDDYLKSGMTDLKYETNSKISI